MQKNRLQVFISTSKKYVPAVVTGVLVLGTETASAANAALADVTAAVADGKEIVGVAASGLVTIAAVVAGVMLVVALLKR